MPYPNTANERPEACSDSAGRLVPCGGMQFRPHGVDYPGHEAAPGPGPGILRPLAPYRTSIVSGNRRKALQSN